MAANEHYIRPGFHTATPYLIVRDAPGVIDFMVGVLDAVEVRRDLRPEGGIMHAEVRIGDSVVELAEAGDEWPPRPGALHVYLRDTDEAYRRALAAGATSLYEPAQMPYGERSAGVRDPSGNHWYLATYTGEQAE